MNGYLSKFTSFSHFERNVNDVKNRKCEIRKVKTHRLNAFNFSVFK